MTKTTNENNIDRQTCKPIIMTKKTRTTTNHITTNANDHYNFFSVNFKGFKVTVETAPAVKVEDKTFYPPESDVKLCYMHNHSVPSSTSIHVSCNTPLKGNLVRITLAYWFGDLVLCDVRVHSGKI
jgi:phage-related protein